MNGTPENLNHASINSEIYIKIKKIRHRCKKCGSQISQNARTCWSCGAKIDPGSAENKKLARYVAVAVIAIIVLLAIMPRATN
ncbi:MAG: hypothetical protein JJE36_05655 [Coriobacteriia bacterium]|nr:hypothetical protein [Coriobacteriia bacterium]